MSEKKTYKIIYTETLEHHFEVEASSPEEARRVFEERNNKGEFDFSYGELVDSSITVEGGEINEFLKYEAFCNEISKIRVHSTILLGRQSSGLFLLRSNVFLHKHIY